MPASAASSHGTFDLHEDEPASAHHFDIDADDGRHSTPVRCCGCFFFAWARRWETGLRAADLAALERRQKALEWSNLRSLAVSDSASMPSASVPSISDITEYECGPSDAKASCLGHTNSFNRGDSRTTPGIRVHPIEMNRVVKDGVGASDGDSCYSTLTIPHHLCLQRS
eukprot:scaffold243228_cov41-Tisochrysis_lutea.AAC.1